MIEKINGLYKELLSKYEGGISNTSTSKFNDIKALFRNRYGLSEDDIYAIGAGSRPGNLEVRLSQGIQATKHTVLCVAFLIDQRDNEDNRIKLTKSAFVTAKKSMGRGKSSYDNILVFIDSNGILYSTGLMYTSDSKLYNLLVSDFNLPVLEKVDEYTSKETISNGIEGKVSIKYRPYLTAIKSKPFLLLAGISGTGKSRIVRELARACWEEGTDDYKAQKPKNFQMVQVKPNWHDSSDLIGYVSRVSGKAEFVAGEFLKFIAKAWEDIETPYFLCLDEMNLAPVEQYFAEYLSVIESRKSHEDGTVTTDPIVEKADEEWYFNLTASLTSNEDIRKQFNKEGICIPQNLIVVGTVNMDETTFSFSRKVLDRAMTIEMNEVDLHGGLTKCHESIGKLGNAELVGSAVEGVDVYNDYTDVCDIALGYLQKVNDVLEGTPFKVAYRTRNEFLLYVVNNLPYSKDENGNDLKQDYVIARALDEITSMKVLSRIEGDDTKVSDEFLDRLSKTIEEGLKAVSGEENTIMSISLAKLKEMKAKLVSGYTSFWS